MQAFVLGAGLGLRLRPLTEELPKPLVPIYQKPLITFSFDHLIDVGCDAFVVNTHPHPQRFTEIFPEGTYRDKPIEFLHEAELLGTGGGIKNALSRLTDETFVVYSGDILANFDLRPLLNEHARGQNLVTLALRETRFPPSITMRDGQVLSIGGKFQYGGNYDFANVSVWNRDAAEELPIGRSVSFIPTLAQMIARAGRIGGVVLSDGGWFNIGSPQEYLEVHRIIFTERWKPAYLDSGNEWPLDIAPDAVIHASAKLSGFYSLGANCEVAAGVQLADSIIWPGARIAPGSNIRNCIVRTRKAANGVFNDAIV